MTRVQRTFIFMYICNYNIYLWNIFFLFGKNIRYIQCYCLKIFRVINVAENVLLAYIRITTNVFVTNRYESLHLLLKEAIDQKS